jgi:ATP-dependent protease Clp ATPase subunit
MIIEDLMLDLMYTLPGQKKVRRVRHHPRGRDEQEKPISLIEKPG